MKEVLHVASEWGVSTTKKAWRIIKEVLHEGFNNKEDLKYHIRNDAFEVLIVNKWKVNSPSNYCVLFSLLSVTPKQKQKI